MRHAPLAAAALLAAVAAFADDPAPKPDAKADPKPFKSMFIGEGGGYKPSDKATDDYLVGNQGAPPPSNANTPAAAASGEVIRLPA